jgi:hypothetical protein
MGMEGTKRSELLAELDEIRKREKEILEKLRIYLPGEGL